MRENHPDDDHNNHHENHEHHEHHDDENDEDASYYEEEIISESDDEYSVVDEEYDDDEVDFDVDDDEDEDDDPEEQHEQEILLSDDENDANSVDDDLLSEDEVALHDSIQERKSSPKQQRYEVETVESLQSDASGFQGTPEPSTWDMPLQQPFVGLEEERQQFEQEIEFPEIVSQNSRQLGQEHETQTILSASANPIGEYHEQQDDIRSKPTEQYESLEKVETATTEKNLLASSMMQPSESHNNKNTLGNGVSPTPIASNITLNNQTQEQIISHSRISSQRTTSRLNDSSSSPKSSPLPKPRQPEQSDMHQALDREDWPHLLKIMDKIRKESPSTIAYELTKTDLRMQSTVLHRAIVHAPLALTKLLLSIVPFDLRLDILLLSDTHGNTPLHLACSNLDVQTKTNSIDDCLIRALAVGAPKAHDIANHQGDLPVSLLFTSPAMKATQDPNLLAIESQAEDLTRRIFNQRPDLLSAQNKYGQTLLHIATSHGVHERVSIYLLENAGYMAGLSDSQGRLPLHHIAATVASPNPPLSLVEQLLIAAPEALTTPCSAGNTPLHLLVSNMTQNIPSREDQASFGMEQFTEMLLGRSDDEAMCPLLVKNKEGLTPLHCCALFAVPAAIVRILMQSQFAYKAATMIDNHKATPFHMICASSNIGTLLEQITLLGNKESSIKKDEKGQTPLHVAAENSHCTESAIQEVITVNPKVAKIENSKGRLPLHSAIRKKASEAVLKVLLQTSPKAVKAMFEGENGVIHESCQYKVPSHILQLILHLYPEGAQQANKFQNLPLHVATAYRCDLATIKVLVKAFPDACTRQNKHKDVPLHYATSYKESKDVIEFLVKAAPSSAMIPNEKDKTPLDLCKENGTAAIIAQALDEVAKHNGKKKRKSHTEQGSLSTPPTPTTPSTKKVDSFQATLERSRTFKVPSKATQDEPKEDGRRSKSLNPSERKSRSRSRDERGRSKSRERSKSRGKHDDKKAKKRDKSIDKDKKRHGSDDRDGYSSTREGDKKLRKREKSRDRSSREGESKKHKSKKKLSNSLGNLNYDHRSDSNGEATNELSKSLSHLDYHHKKDRKRDSSSKKSKSHRSRSKSPSKSPSRHSHSKGSNSLKKEREDTKHSRRRSGTESDLNKKSDIVRKLPRSASENSKYDKPSKSTGRPPLSPGTLIFKKSKASLAIKEEIADGSIEGLPPTASVISSLDKKRNSLPKTAKSKSKLVEQTPTTKKKRSILKNSPTPSELSPESDDLTSPWPASLIQFDPNAPDEVSLQLDSPAIRMKKALFPPRLLHKIPNNDDSSGSISIHEEKKKSSKKTSKHSSKILNDSSGSESHSDEKEKRQKKPSKRSNKVNESSGSISLSDDKKKHRKKSSRRSTDNLNDSSGSAPLHGDREKMKKKSSKHSSHRLS